MEGQGGVWTGVDWLGRVRTVEARHDMVRFSLPSAEKRAGGF